LKTFAALGVYGMSAITAITAQNTVEVRAVQDADLAIIGAQIDAVIQDIGVDAAKTGMLHTKEIIELVSDKIDEYGFPVVVDPVMVAKSGAELLTPEARDTLVKKLLPMATVVTPNAMEAEAITGLKVSTIEEGKAAAEAIACMGAEAVLVKGGHIFDEDATDILYYDGGFRLLRGKRHDARDTHGAGCSLSAAIAAELAKGRGIFDSVERAKRFVNVAILHGLRIGRGHGPLNHMAELVNDSERYRVLEDLRKSVKTLECTPGLARLVAEVQLNVGMALPYASTVEDIAAMEGRITRRGEAVRASGCPWFGASGHIARTILAVRRFNPAMRAAMNLRYSEETLEALRGMGLVVSYYDRKEEPPESKRKEGNTTYWGAEQAVMRVGQVPDAIYHLGDWGKEPMIVLLGESATQVALRAVELTRRMT
ncbi:MAG: bifunctional hydroxymethylpyrimidine kinase/phosphomethylpyrimidine kinase, partial [Candidatus Bathyarchaeota archaeon]|nr:bifunctional hydroxymethylpyrimidine kinase/phosphomethylpyrimidine kinase [Candidatus Bathyarchaeota archaeon]